MSDKKNKGCMPVLVIVSVIVCLLAGGTWYTKKEYKSKQEIIKKALAELPQFDEVARAGEIAEEHGFHYPVPEPLMTPEAISAQAKKEAEELADKKFSVTEFNKTQSEILKKYRIAKNGDKVSFIMNTTGETITGVFKGSFKDNKGRFVKVGIHEYRFPDIMDDYHYLFDSSVAAQKAGDLLRDLKKDFKISRHKFVLNSMNEIKEKLYTSSGYTKVGEKWLTNNDFLLEELAKRKKAYQKKIDVETKKIYEANKLFGLIDVNVIPPIEEAKSN